MGTILKIILVFVLLVIILTVSISFWLSFYKWINSYKNAGVKMSFGQFRRIYELAPNEWKQGFDYIYYREEWIPVYDTRNEIRGTYIRTTIAMKTLFDFWRLLFWKDEIDRKREREERLKKEKASFKNLTIMIENDAETIRKKLEEEEKKAENLRQEIIDRLGGNK